MNLITRTPDFSGQAIPHTLLNHLISQQETGKLTIQNPFDEFVVWQIYLGKGKINFANSVSGSVERLNYLIGSHLNENKITLPPQINNDYDYLCELRKKDFFSFQQTRTILAQLTQEALVQILSLPKAHYTFDKNDNLHELFLNLDLEKSLTDLKPKIRYWWELRTEINSPFQRPLVENWSVLQQSLMKKQSFRKQWLRGFHQCVEDLDCLYSIATKTQLSTLQLALVLRPLIKTGEIKMLPYQEILIDHRPLIVYVNDRPAMQRVFKYTLEAGGFRTTCLENPFKALSILLGQKPAAIILDAQMQEINGYHLCSLCRKSGVLNNVPILIVGEKNSIAGRIRAKLSGASAYITKSLLPKELLQSINQCLVSVKTS